MEQQVRPRPSPERNCEREEGTELIFTLTLTLTLIMGAQLLFIGVAPQSVTLSSVPSVGPFRGAEHENSGDAERTGAL